MVLRTIQMTYYDVFQHALWAFWDLLMHIFVFTKNTYMKDPGRYLVAKNIHTESWGIIRFVVR